MEKIKYSGTQQIEGINSEDCLKALRTELRALSQQEVQKALETHFFENIQRKNFISLNCLADHSQSWDINKGNQFS